MKNSVYMLKLSDFGLMNTLLNKLESRLKIGVSQTLSVKTLGVETHGRLGERTFSVLAEMLKSGARPSHACNILSEYVATTLMYDKRKEQITSTLKTLSIPLHATLAATFALQTTLLSILSQISSLLGSQLMIIRPIPAETVVTYFYTIIAVTSLITALNIYLAEGDFMSTLKYYFGIILTVSGISYFVMSTSSEQLLSSFMGLTQRIQNLSPG